MATENQDIEQAKYCAVLHMKELHRQYKNKEAADFLKPCTECNYYVTCKGDWTGQIDCLDVKGVKFNLEI